MNVRSLLTGQGILGLIIGVLAYEHLRKRA